MKDPRQIAYDTVDELLKIGLAQGHQAEKWRDEPQDNHLDKCIRHIMTFKLMRDGNQKPDGENHLRNAICRLSLALTQEMSDF